jgi:hypothetical protein
VRNNRNRKERGSVEAGSAMYGRCVHSRTGETSRSTSIDGSLGTADCGED